MILVRSEREVGALALGEDVMFVRVRLRGIGSCASRGIGALREDVVRASERGIGSC